MEEEEETEMREVGTGHSQGEIKPETRGLEERKEMVKGEFSGKPTKHTRDQKGETGETRMGGLWLKKSLSLQLGRILVMRGGEETLLVGNSGDRERGVAIERIVERGGVRVGTGTEKS